ncbi:hypothetical protein BZG01_03245 [Labilibaculum manganireducens]|uniref:Glycosyltransferase 2-like domain-containing protein n=1 Tax=Labilibaculum manganireducens TaxID=1940525 RepID=A0A2N3IEM1_9BACT|nr:glycosyltransferase family 2 protein [Labilibaculum manganireducens]PKQ68746.1 hypothetical protein BZG01_03245 [Labilibaculum manganireducens]
MSLPIVSIVLLNWNGDKYINDCLKSVLCQDYSNLETVIVDNNSTDDSLNKAKVLCSDAIFCESDVNLGFTGGMNLGISVSTGKYILLLNNDVYLDSSYVSQCVEFLEKPEYSNVGCVAGSEFLWNKSELTNIKVSQGVLFIKYRLQLKEMGHANELQECFGVSGSFPIFRRAAIDDLVDVSGHFFDEAFETGWEDTDVRFRLFFRNWKTYFIPDAKAWHVGSGSDNENKSLISKSRDYQIRIFRNRRYVINKNIPNVFFLWRVFLFFLEPVIFFYYCTVSIKTARYMVKGNLLAFETSSDTKFKRFKIMSSLLINPLDLKQYIKNK